MEAQRPEQQNWAVLGLHCADLGKHAPLPVSEAFCGLPAALSEIESVPVRLPAAVGLKVTLIVHLAPGAKVTLQVSVSPKSAVAVMPVICSAPVPELVTVSGSGGVVSPSYSKGPKAKLEGEREA